MNSFLISKRKTIELIILFVFCAVIYLIWNSLDFVILFGLGFIWNWAASQEPEIEIKNPKRYKFSTLKTVFNLQNLFLSPFAHMPEYIKIFIKILPAGIFWWAVIYFNESQMPWWAVFLGSLAAELVQLEPKLFKSKGSLP